MELIKTKVKIVNFVDFQKEKRNGAMIPEDRFDVKEVFYFLKDGRIYSVFIY